MCSTDDCKFGLGAVQCRGVPVVVEHDFHHVKVVSVVHLDRSPSGIADFAGASRALAL